MKEQWENLSEEQRGTMMQLVRYALAGMVITILFAFAYWAVATWGGIDPNLSLAIVFVIFSGISFIVHGRFSFAGHGARDNAPVRGTKFLIINVMGFALNQFWVWLLVKQLAGPTWWPTIPFVLVTPWLTFALHRRFVYN